jgi:hypothetical protein
MTSMNRLAGVKQGALVVAVCVLVGSLAHAQATGSVQGTVVAGTSVPVVAAKVKARHTATDTTFTTTTNDRGEYRLDLLPPGTYQVTAVAPDFGPALVTVSVALGATATANFDPSTPAPPNRPVATGLRAIRFEGSGRVGWTFSDGVSASSPVTASDGNLYDRVDPVDSMSWGFTLGVFLNRKYEVEFIFDRQRTTLEASGTRTVEVDSLDVSNYHGALAYNFGTEDSSMRPYFFGGVGATSYSPLSFVGADGKTREIAGQTRLSPTFGGGVKAYKGRIGARAELRMTPTYIKSDTTGWWCDPYWGCYATSKSQYAWQIQMTGGVTVRF